MIELHNDALVFRFPEVHPEAQLTLDFQRTFRIPDDGKTYPLPPGFGCFPLRHVDDHSERVPASWIERGGVMLPMYQAEAMWLLFHSAHVDGRAEYPFAVKIAAGKIDAVSGNSWTDGLHRRPQDYVVAPTQPWLDGYCVKKGVIRQFVAMPLGSGYSAEEQLTGAAEWGGVQISVYPMKRDVFERRFPKSRMSATRAFGVEESLDVACAAPDMALAPGGTMRQEIYDDPFDLSDWELSQRSRCFVHIANSLVWRAITGTEPPTTPPTAEEYERAGLPWFDFYSDAHAVAGSDRLDGLDSVADKAKKKGDAVLPENESVQPKQVVGLGERHPGRVREW